MIVIPMAGLGSRFAKAGYDVPKYMLEARGQSLFAHAVSSFSNFFGEQTILLVCRDVDGTLKFLDAELAKLGLREGDVDVCVLDAPTSGQAETVAQALRRSDIDGAEPLTVFNIDTIRPDFNYPQAFDLSRIDGYLEVCRAEGEHWSFVRPEDPTIDSGRVIEVTEKVRVSDLCSTGLYYFRSVDFFLSLYAEVENADLNGLQGGERYIAPLYEIALKRGADIRYHVIDRDEVTFCGTPSAYDAFRKESAIASKIAFCISGQIRGPKSFLREIAELADNVGADIFLSVWDKRGRKSFSGATHLPQLSRIMGDIPAQMLPRAFHNRMNTVFPEAGRGLGSFSEDVRDDISEVFPNAVTDIETPILNLDFDTEGQDTNSLRMLYKIWRCNRLKQNAEVARGYKYDTVVRLRPDVLPDVEAYVKMGVASNCVAFPPSRAKKPYLNDTFWISGSQADDYLSSLFGSALLAPLRVWHNIHRELYDHAIAGGFQFSYIPFKKGFAQAVVEADQAMARDLVSNALIQKTYTLPDGFSTSSAELLGRLMQLQTVPPDMPNAFASIVEISQLSDDICVLKAGLLAAVDRQPDAEARDLCACILTAGVLFAIECNAIGGYPLRDFGLESFLNAWKGPLSAIDEMPSAQDLGADKEGTAGPLLEMANRAYIIARQRIGQDALYEAFDSVVAHVEAHEQITNLRARRRSAGLKVAQDD